MDYRFSEQRRDFLAGQSMSKIIVEHDDKFEYNLEVSYELNFEKWLRWTNREKRNYKETEYTHEQGKKIFDSLYGGV